MSITARIRSRHAQSRARRDFNRAVSGASTPALRNELITMAQNQNGLR